jgi:hypothetical protein
MEWLKIRILIELRSSGPLLTWWCTLWRKNVDDGRRFWYSILDAWSGCRQLRSFWWGCLRQMSSCLKSLRRKFRLESNHHEEEQVPTMVQRLRKWSISFWSCCARIRQPAVLNCKLLWLQAKHYEQKSILSMWILVLARLKHSVGLHWLLSASGWQSERWLQSFHSVGLEIWWSPAQLQCCWLPCRICLSCFQVI